MFILEYYVEHSITRNIIVLSLFQLFGIIAEGFSFPIVILINQKIALSNWNALLFVSMSIVLTVVLLSLPLMLKLGVRVYSYTESDLNTYMPLAATLLYAQFGIQIFKVISMNVFTSLDLILSSGVTLFFIGYVVTHLIHLTQLMGQESNIAAIKLGKSIAGNYLSNRHDIKNMLHTLNYASEIDSAEVSNAPICQSLLRLKLQETTVLGIKIVVHAETDLNINTNPIENHSSNKELDAAIILGILLDNAKDHLLAHPELTRQIDLSIDWNTFRMKVANPIAIDGYATLEKVFDKGNSSKINDLKTGFGLYNAHMIAERMNYNLSFTSAHGQVIFEVI